MLGFNKEKDYEQMDSMILEKLSKLSRAKYPTCLKLYRNSGSTSPLRRRKQIS